MSLLNEYIQKEQQLKKLQDDLQRMEGDQRLQGELEFKERLETLMEEFGKVPADIIALFEPHVAPSDLHKASSSSTDGRRKRRLKVYKNPHTGEVIETRGGNHKGLRAWKAEYGDETVESWLERTED